jgi:hypothetical protein
VLCRDRPDLAGALSDGIQGGHAGKDSTPLVGLSRLRG